MCQLGLRPALQGGSHHHIHSSQIPDKPAGRPGSSVRRAAQQPETESGPARAQQAWSASSSCPTLTPRKPQEHSHPPQLPVRREGSWGDGLDPIELQAAAEGEHRGSPGSGHQPLLLPVGFTCPNWALCPSCPCSQPLYGVAGRAQAEKRGCCDLSSIFPGLHG